METGGYVVRMAFATAGFFEDLLFIPLELAEVIGEKDAGKEGGCGRSAAHAEGNFVVKMQF